MPHAGIYMMYFSMLCTIACACSESVPAFIYLFDTSITLTVVFCNRLARFGSQKRRSESEGIMFYTSGSNSYGAYRKSKMMIDAFNVALTIVIVVLFMGVIFWREMRPILFPVIFMAGTLDNGLAATKNFMNNNKIAGIVLAVVTVLLLLLAMISWSIR